MPIPTLTTDRLILRPVELSDAPTVRKLAGAKEVAANTLTIPHPYPDGAAEAWIEKHADDWEAQKTLVLAVTTEEDGLVGVVGLEFNMPHLRAELGYWIGVPYWKRGYATEAAQAMLDHGFGALGLNRIEAQYLVRNPASSRVMEKLGMTYEGIHRQYVVKWDVPEDMGIYAVLASERGGPLPE